MSDRDVDRIHVPECVPVLIAEQLIFYLAGGGLLLMVGGPQWTVPPMPASALLAGVIALLVSTAALFVRVAWAGSFAEPASRVQQVAMAWIFAYTLQYTVFSIVLRLQMADDDVTLADDAFIIMYNAERVQPYGPGTTTMHMVVSVVLCALLLTLFTATHYFARGKEQSTVEWSLLAALFLAQSQFFLFHAEDLAAATRANERCTRVVCDVVHLVVAVAVIAGLMVEHFVMEALWEHARRLRRPTEALVYLCVHVLGIPTGGFVAVHFVSWLQVQGLYTANLIVLAILTMSRLYTAVKEWRSLKQGLAEVKQLPTKTLLKATMVKGTQQPRYFFKRMGAKDSRQEKKD
jgi:hypothetical protein